MSSLNPRRIRATHICDDCGQRPGGVETFLGFHVCVGCQQQRLRMVPLLSLVVRMEPPETLRAMAGLIDIAGCGDEAERREMLDLIDCLLAARRPIAIPKVA